MNLPEVNPVQPWQTSGRIAMPTFAGNRLLLFDSFYNLSFLRGTSDGG